MKVWTKDEIKDLMERRDDMVVCFLLKIYDQQTADEQMMGATIEHNGVGFNGCDSDILSSFARFYQERGFLSERQMQIARKKMKKYAGQIVELANAHERKKEKV